MMQLPECSACRRVFDTYNVALTEMEWPDDIPLRERNGDRMTVGVVCCDTCLLRAAEQQKTTPIAKVRLNREAGSIAIDAPKGSGLSIQERNLLTSSIASTVGDWLKAAGWIRRIDN